MQRHQCLPHTICQQKGSSGCAFTGELNQRLLGALTKKEEKKKKKEE